MNGIAAADGDAFDAFAEGDDLSGDVAAEDEWDGDLRRGKTVPNPEIEVVERARAHAEEDFAGARDRIGDGRELEVLRPAEGFQDRGFHALILAKDGAKRQAPFFSAPWKVAESSEIISSFLRIVSSRRWRSFSQSEKRASVTSRSCRVRAVCSASVPICARAS